MSINDDEILTHPSYGMVQFSRVTGGNCRLFGSALEGHNHRIELRIFEAEMHIDHDLHMERPYGKGQIVEVALSAAQFAELLTTMNSSMGVPCTIMRRMGAGAIEEPPAVAVESANVRTDFAAKMAALKPNLRERAQAILDLLPASLNKGARRQIEIGVERLAAQVTESATFALDQFQEAAERVTTSAKAEIDAVVTHVVQATGIEALREMRARGEVPTLPAHEETSK